jgi:hypothetical protein
VVSSFHCGCGCGWGCKGGCECVAVVMGGSVVLGLMRTDAFAMVPLVVGLTAHGVGDSR